MTDAAELKVVVSHTDKGVEAFLRKLQDQLEKTNQSSTRTGQAFGRNIASGTQQAESAALRFQAALARMDAQGGNTEQAITRLRGALQNISTTTPAVLQVQGQLAKLEQQAHQNVSTFQRLGNAASGLNTALGGIGFALGAQQIIAYSAASIDLANRTDNAKRSLQALAGTPELYAQALATATQQQRLFGGSLEENISGIQGLITVSRSSGVELQKLVDLSQRLSVKDPAQGIAGARIALNEALAGDPTSLAKRYEIPRAALAKIRDESTSAAEKLAIIDQYLNQIGITSATVSGAINEETLAFNRLGAAIEAAQIKLGAFLSQKLAPAATGGAALIESVTGGANQNEVLTALIVSLQEYTGARNAASDANVQFVSSLLNMIGVQSQAAAQTQADAAAQAAAAERTATYQASVDQLASALASGVISQEQYAQAVAELGAQYQLSGQQAGENGAAIAAMEGQMRSATEGADALTTALDADAQQSAIAEVNAQALTEAKRNLQDSAQAAAQAVLTGGGNIEATAARLAASSSLVDQLTAAYLRLYNAQGLVAGAQRLANQKANTTVLGTANAGSAGRRGNGDSAIDDVVRLQKEQKAAAEAERQYNEALGGTQTQLKNVQDELANAAVGSKEYYDLKKRELELNRQIARDAAKGGKGGRAPKVSAAEKEAQQLLETQNKYSQDSAELEREHQDRLAEIVADGAKKRREAEEKFAQASLDSRASFYERLGEIEDTGVQQQLSAKYEAAVQEANKIAQESGADAADAYLKAAEQAIDEESGLEQKIAEAEKNGDAARAEYYRGVLALRQAANKNELDAIRNHGSDIASETAARYAEEERQYAEHLDKMLATYNEKVGKITGAGPGALPPAPGVPAAPGTARPVAAAPATATQPAPVKDEAAAQATADGWAAIQERLSAIEAAVNSLAPHIDGTTGAVRSLAQRGVKAG